MARQHTSLPDGLLLVAVIIGWAVLDWLGSENITMDEIVQEVRLQGMTSLTEVELVALEGDGQMSIILKDQRGRRQGKDLA